MITTDGHETMMFSESNPIDVVPLNSVPMGMDGGKIGGGENNGFFQHVAQKKFKQKSSLISRIRSNSACRNYMVQSNSLPKSSPLYSSGKLRNHARKQVDVKHIGERFSSKEACDELLAYEVQTQLNLLLYVGIVSFKYRMIMDKFSKFYIAIVSSASSAFAFLNKLLEKCLNLCIFN